MSDWHNLLKNKNNRVNIYIFLYHLSLVNRGIDRRNQSLLSCSSLLLIEEELPLVVCIQSVSALSLFLVCLYFVRLSVLVNKAKRTEAKSIVVIVRLSCRNRLLELVVRIGFQN